MKTKLLIIAGLIGVCCLISCKKEGMDNHGNSSLPELEEVNDVCTKMDDLNFMKYCYDNFDANKDGKVSMSEANAVRTISSALLINSGSASLHYAVSFSGIEYFSNLENISLGASNISISPRVKTMDLCYNKHLISISMHDVSHISSLDLRSNVELKSINMHYCTGLTSIYLPKSIESIPASAFKGCKKISIVDMSQCVNLKEIKGSDTFTSEVIDEFLIGASIPPKTSEGPIKSKSIKVLIVPAESVEAYKKSEWGDYAEKIIPIGN